MHPLTPYTWETCNNVTTNPWPDAGWSDIFAVIEKNDNHQIDITFLPPAFCDPKHYVPPDHGSVLITFSVVMFIITIMFVIARFWTRLYVAGKLGWDDWTIVLAASVFAVSTMLEVYGMLSSDSVQIRDLKLIHL